MTCTPLTEGKIHNVQKGTASNVRPVRNPPSPAVSKESMAQYRAEMKEQDAIMTRIGNDINLDSNFHINTVAMPMLSYVHAGNAFWKGVILELVQNQGKTEAEVREFLVSKDARWMLDGGGEDITELGMKMAREQFK